MTKILIVEDEAKIARFVELELTHEGYEVDKVDNGRDAVDAALANDYDLVLLDILLPQLNGMVYDIPCLQSTGGTIVYYPMSVVFCDGL